MWPIFHRRENLNTMKHIQSPKDLSETRTLKASIDDTLLLHIMDPNILQTFIINNIKYVTYESQFTTQNHV